MILKQKRLIILLKKNFLEIIQIICGTVVMAMGIGLFLIPNKLSTGGFSGIATIIYYIFKLPVGTVTFVLNIPIFIYAFIKLGKKTVLRALFGTLCLSIFIDLFESIGPLTEDKILACLYGGILVGIGTAIILKANASTGGSDLLSQIIKKNKPDIRSGTAIVIFDTIVVGINAIVFSKIEIALYSAIAIFIMGKAIDVLLEGIYFTKVIYVVSDRYKEIANRIENEVSRGITGIYAKGMYTNKDKMLLLCVAGRNEVTQIRKIVKSIDRRAFLIISNAREVFGKGFK
ncbi:MAG: YitT family protein [Clostridia bacterium]|nr:YitT family protein [Clostridia bacterium]